MNDVAVAWRDGGSTRFDRIEIRQGWLHAWRNSKSVAVYSVEAVKKIERIEADEKP